MNRLSLINPWSLSLVLCLVSGCGSPSSTDDETDLPDAWDTEGASTNMLREFNGPCYSAVSVDAQGDIYIVGSTVSRPYEECDIKCSLSTMIARKLDPDGHDLVVVTDEFTMPKYDSTGFEILPLDDGGFLLAGSRSPDQSGSAALLQRRDASGALVWHELAGAEIDAAGIVGAGLAPGGVVIVGVAGGDVLHFSAEGVPLGPLVTDLRGVKGLATDATGGYVVLGPQYVSRYHLTEGLVWEDPLDHLVETEAIAATPAGDAVAVGYRTVGGGRPKQPFVRKYAAATGLLWERTVDEGPPRDEKGVVDPRHLGVTILPDGRIAVVGNAHGADAIAILRVYSAEGELLDTRRFDHPRVSHELELDVAVTPEGDLVSVGCSAYGAAWVRLETL